MIAYLTFTKCRENLISRKVKRHISQVINFAISKNAQVKFFKIKKTLGAEGSSDSENDAVEIRILLEKGGAYLKVSYHKHILIVQLHLVHEHFFMDYRLEASPSFSFQNSLLNTFRKGSTTLHSMSILNVAESSQDIIQDALCLSLCI